MAEETDMKSSASQNRMRPVHPGEILREDYLKPLGLSANALAHALKVPASRINDIVLERRGITVDTAMRLVRYFGGDVQSWMNLQTAYEIKVAEQALAKKIKDEVQPLAA
jgi:addiction module HigA family antidote